jgi:AcrR family transcriptional regulator
MRSPARSKLEPRKLPRQERSHEMVERILGTARQLSREIGFRGVSTAQIAQHAGLSVGSIYQYFPNKEAIMVELTRRWLAQFQPIVEHARARPRPRTWRALEATLAELFDRADRLYREAPDMLAVLELMAASPELRGVEETHDRAIIASFSRWLREINPELPEAAATRLGELILAVGHVCLKASAAGPPARGRLIREDLKAMMQALLRPQVGLR